jgi:hemolysin activation/secretion protein
MVRGYELNVLDGKSYFLNRNTLKFQLLNKIFKLPFLPIKQFNQIPIAIYPTIFYDFAYVHNDFSESENKLINKWISGGGLGFDVVTYYNLVCKFGFPVTNGNKIGLVLGIGREF